jgi:hypothetical protein
LLQQIVITISLYYFLKNAQKVRSDSKVHECWRDGDSSQHLLYNKCVNYFNSKKGIIERQKHLHFVDDDKLG